MDRTRRNRATRLVLVCMMGVCLAPEALRTTIEAKVNDQIITTRDVLGQGHGRLQQLASQKLPDYSQQAEELGRTALRELIEAKLLEAEGEKLIKDRPLAKDFIERAVREEIEKQRLQFRGEGNLRDHIEEKMNLTYTEYRKRLWSDRLRGLILDKEVRVGLLVQPFEVREYYEKHRADFLDHGKVLYRQISLGVSTLADLPRQRRLADELVRRARQGESFEVLAKDYSSGGSHAPPKEPVVLSGLSEPLRNALIRMQPGEVSDPIVAEHAIWILALRKLEPEPFQEVQSKIGDILRRNKRTARLAALTDRLWRENYVWIRGVGRVTKMPEARALRIGSDLRSGDVAPSARGAGPGAR